MIGRVDHGGRALVEVELLPPPGAAPVRVEVWIDTGFTGDLVLPRAWIERLALNASGTVTAVLADGAEVAMRTYTCFVHWYGRRERLEIVESDGAYPLLGVGLLFERDLRINYHDGTVSLEYWHG